MPKSQGALLAFHQKLDGLQGSKDEGQRVFPGPVSFSFATFVGHDRSLTGTM
jgi:hypothetical protein